MNKDVKLSLCLILFIPPIFMPVYQSSALIIRSDYRTVYFDLNHQIVQVFLKNNGVAVIRYNISLDITYGSLLGISIKIPEPRIFKDDENKIYVNDGRVFNIRHYPDPSDINLIWFDTSTGERISAGYTVTFIVVYETVNPIIDFIDNPNGPGALAVFHWAPTQWA
ncbi:MAG: hypothetical protein ACTSRP_27505, partial [Candidatus Helarchaeota archaeon]